MNLEITSAVKDCLTREWDVEVLINPKLYKYTVSDYDYERSIKQYEQRNYPESLCILKGVK